MYLEKCVEMGKVNQGRMIDESDVLNWQSCAQKCLDNTECLKWTWKRKESGDHKCKLKGGDNTETLDEENKVCGTKSPDCKELGKLKENSTILEAVLEMQFEI